MENEGGAASKRTMKDRDEATLAVWREGNIPARALQAHEGEGEFVFYDGPPFATGLPHYGHLLAGTIKDVIPRYQTMRGKHIRRQWGWDCHGLPVENLIEKQLSLATKKDIEAYGIDRFNTAAKDAVLEFADDWRAIVPRLGRFVDMDHPYKTMDASYTESVWWAFATLFRKGLVYEGYKAMHLCPRCGTTLANFEVALNYKDLKDISVTVRFRMLPGQTVLGCSTDEMPTFFLAWTTTPWTLPGNVALAVGPEVEYVMVEKEGEDGVMSRFVLAKERCEKYFGTEGYRVVGTTKGSELAGCSYAPLYSHFASREDLEYRENGWKVYLADFVTTTDGTGIVHIAPAFGEDDMALGKRMKLPFVQHVGSDGAILSEVTEFAGLQAKPKDDPSATDIVVIKDLAAKGVLFAKEKIEHAYPHCWRCDTPLLNYATSSWFVAVEKIKDALIAANQSVTWVPEHMKEGRFGKWVEGARDWAVSRSRYWGAPIPVWKCNKCGNVESIATLAELRSKTRRTNTYHVVRHGESITNAEGLVSCSPDPEAPYPLTERGRAQARAAGLKLKDAKIDLVIASPVRRAHETASIIAEEIGIAPEAIVIEPGLAEWNIGNWEGKSLADFRAAFPSTAERFTRAPEGGETIRDLAVRVGRTIEEIDRTYAGKTILLVTHEYPAWMLDTVAQGLTDEGSLALRADGQEDYIGNGEVRPFAYAPIPHNARYELEFHRPAIDTVSYRCSCELGDMERVRDVFDCWFESGSMPYAQFHYLGDDTTPEGKAFRAQFPADFIAEGVDQTRGWFYTLLVLAVGLFGEAPYRHVIVNGLILAEDGQKMSKSKGNYPDPMLLVEKYGADALRFYLLSSPAVRGDEFRFTESGVVEIVKKLILRLDNVRSFRTMYGKGSPVPVGVPHSTNVLDRFILARLSVLRDEITEAFESYELDRACRPILGFVDDLSTWYLRRSRDRWSGEEGIDRDEAEATLSFVLATLARLLAPIAPFYAEEMYRELVPSAESVHLTTWPDAIPREDEVLTTMAHTRAVVSSALEMRARAGIKVRQPLASLSLPEADPLHFDPALAAIVRDEVNVCALVVGPEESLDTVITPVLAAQGLERDLIRHIQDLRKKGGLVPSDRAIVTITTDEAGAAFLRDHADALAQATNAVSVSAGPDVVDDAPVVAPIASFAVAVLKG